jgi:ribosome-associated translation inhibitor RaiA
MLIQVNTDNNIDGHEAMAARVRAAVENELSRVSKHVTRVEVHLSDENSHKSGQNDKRCVMEARLESRQPVTISHQADTIDQAVDGAVEKLAGLIESTLERLRDQKRSKTNLPPAGEELPEEELPEE